MRDSRCVSRETESQEGIEPSHADLQTTLLPREPAHGSRGRRDGAHREMRAVTRECPRDGASRGNRTLITGLEDQGPTLGRCSRVDALPTASGTRPSAAGAARCGIGESRTRISRVQTGGSPVELRSRAAQAALRRDPRGPRESLGSLVERRGIAPRSLPCEGSVLLLNHRPVHRVAARPARCDRCGRPRRNRTLSIGLGNPLVAMTLRPRKGAECTQRLVRESNPSHPVDSGVATPVASRGMKGERAREHGVPGRSRTCVGRFRKPEPLCSATRTWGRAFARGDVRGSHPPALGHSQLSSLDEQRHRAFTSAGAEAVGRRGLAPRSSVFQTDAITRPAHGP